MRTLFLSESRLPRLQLFDCNRHPRLPYLPASGPPTDSLSLLAACRYIIKVISIIDHGTGKVLNGTGEAEFRTTYCGYPASGLLFVAALLDSKS